MKIAVVCPGSPVRGRAEVERAKGDYVAQRSLMRSLKQRGIECVGFRTGVGDHPSDFVDASENEWRVGTIDLGSPIYGRKIRSQTLTDMIRRFNPSCIFLKDAGLAMREGLGDHPAPWIVMQSGTSHFRLLEADLVLSENGHQSLWLKRHLGPPSIVLPKQVHPAFVSESPSTAPIEYDCIVVSRFSEGKNHGALEGLVRSGYRIALVGDGPLREEYMRRWEPYPNAIFMGDLPPEAVASRLRSSRVLVHPSLGEGVPRVAVEAMAAGVPTVGLRGVIDGVIGHGCEGLVVEEAELDASIEALLSDERLYSRLSSGSKAAFYERYSSMAFETAIDDVAKAMAYFPGRRVRRSRPSTRLNILSHRVAGALAWRARLILRS